jgi:hypothetical protein
MKKTNKTRYEAYDSSDWEKAFFDEQTHGFVVIHRLHGKQERAGNLKIAMQLVTFGYAIELLPVATEKSYDSHIDDEAWEFKTTLGSSTSVQKRLRVGREQCENILLVVPERFILREILRGIISAVNMDREKMIQVIGLIFTEKLEIGIIKLTRNEIKNRNFTKLSVFFDDQEVDND